MTIHSQLTEEKVPTGTPSTQPSEEVQVHVVGDHRLVTVHVNSLNS